MCNEETEHNADSIYIEYGICKYIPSEIVIINADLFLQFRTFEYLVQQRRKTFNFLSQFSAFLLMIRIRMFQTPKTVSAAIRRIPNSLTQM